MLRLTRQAAKLSNWNPKPEMHGPDPQPAGDVTFEFNAASETLLPMLHPMLRGLLFHKDGTVQHDLADQTAHAPDLRFPQMPGPFAWMLPFTSGTLTVHIGDLADSDIVLPANFRKAVTFTPMQGGTVVVSVQARCHPDSEQAGAIYCLMGKEVAISLNPSAEVDDDDKETGALV